VGHRDDAGHGGAWSEPHIAACDDALTAAAARYPNLKGYDWAGVVQDGYLQRAGIHHVRGVRPTGG
jgi:hypothetical protein